MLPRKVWYLKYRWQPNGTNILLKVDGLKRLHYVHILCLYMYILRRSERCRKVPAADLDFGQEQEQILSRHRIDKSKLQSLHHLACGGIFGERDKLRLHRSPSRPVAQYNNDGKKLGTFSFLSSAPPTCQCQPPNHSYEPFLQVQESPLRIDHQHPRASHLQDRSIPRCPK